MSSPRPELRPQYLRRDPTPARLPWSTLLNHPRRGPGPGSDWVQPWHKRLERRPWSEMEWSSDDSDGGDEA